MVSSAEHEPEEHRPKGIPRRFWVMFLASLGILISYADRSNMAVAIVAIAKEYDYTKQQQGFILSAFFFGYIMTQILGGAMADRYGAKPVLAIGVAFPSAHALVGVFGASDPESCRGITEQEVRYIRHQQQLDGQVEGYGNHVLDQVQVFGSAELDSDSETEDPNPSPELQATYHALTTERQSDEIRHQVEPIRKLSEEEDTPPNIDHASRWTSFRNRVRSKAVTNMRMSSSAPVPWKLLLKRREVWAIILSQFCAAFGFFVMQSWTPTFYLEYFGVDVGKIGYFSVSQVIGGLGIATALVLAVTVARSAYGAMALITVGMALNGFTMIGASAYQHDICPQYAGFIFSLGNTAGTIPGIVGVMLAGLLKIHT
ncbi:hypothetical protein BGZ59_006856 [Podila verticillata]|nr:hypothetical protein BGZ59_006856 [Podila verticillata]